MKFSYALVLKGESIDCDDNYSFVFPYENRGYLFDLIWLALPS